MLQGSSHEQVTLHAQVTALLLMVLGWSLNFKKSDFVPTQTAVHPGFKFDTSAMTISCPQDKVVRLQDFCFKIMQAKLVTVHDAERLLGLMESVRPVTHFAALHYISIQKQLLKVKSYVRKPAQIIFLSHRSIASFA